MPFESTVGESDLVLGQEYFGSVVMNVKQDVQDKNGKYRVKRFVTLKSGVILIEEYVREKSAGKVEAKEYGLPPGQFEDEPPKDDSETRARARAMIANRSKPEKEKKKKKKSKKNKKPKPEPESEKPKADIPMFWELEQREPDKLDPKQELDIFNVPTKVVPSSQLSQALAEDDAEVPLLGVWKHGTDDADDNDWEPMDAIITKKPDTSLGPQEPQGLVVMKGDADPKVPGNLKFCPPGENPPPKYKKVGHWRPGKLNRDWPPVKEERPRSLRNSRKLKIPFLDGEVAKVVPQSKAPRRQSGGLPLTGVWKHDNDTDDTDWEPLDVLLSIEPLSFKPGQPHGILAVDDGVEPNIYGTIDPPELKFIPPGQEPPEHHHRVGHWRPGKMHQEWPPVKKPSRSNRRDSAKVYPPDLDEEYAQVVPRSKAPNRQFADKPITGVWNHDDDTDDSDWEPMDVVITKDPPHGIVAVEKGFQPNRDGKPDPSDLTFFPPGEKTPKNYSKIGYWKPKDSKQAWPPPGKLRKPKLPDLDGELAKVVPQSKLPRKQGRDNEPLAGSWVHFDDTDDSDWEPMDVVISDEPHSFLEPGEPHGMVAVEEGTKPNRVGTLDPSDLKFFTPGEEPSRKYTKVGHWRPNKLDQEWPPGKPDIFDLDGEFAKVVPQSKLPHRQGKDAPLTGAWVQNDDTDDSDWEPMDVVISDEPVSFLQPGEPQGIVALEDGTMPNKVGKLDPSDLKFFKPGEEPPRKFTKVGHWRPKKLDQEWPPGKPKLPSLDGEVAKVVPESKLPRRLGKNDPPTGAWIHSDDTDDSDWEPMDVVISDEPASFLEPGEPQGIVGVEEGTVVPNKVGKLDPSALKFFTPGEEPPRKFNKVGHWRPKDMFQEFPPAKPALPDLDGETAKVVPGAKLPRRLAASDPVTGAWEHNDDNVDDSDWDPIEVVISEEDPASFLPPEVPHGVVGVEDGTEPKKVGKLDPSDLKFFAPGEELPRKYNKIGHWRPKKLDQEWPPGKPKLPNLDGKVAKILPDSKLPKRQFINDPVTGSWKHNDDTDDSDWKPMDVIITEEPAKFLEPDEPHGIVAVKDGVKPNRVGKLDPADLKFFTPGEEPPRNYNKLGHWRPEALDQSWPPGKPKLPNLDGEVVTVLPKPKLPTIRKPRDDDPLTGSWKHNDNTDDSKWLPLDVIVSKDPPSLRPGEHQGIVAVKDGVKPNKVGKLDTADLEFFTPGADPPRKYMKLGHWRPKELNQEWPPEKPRKLPDFDGDRVTVLPRSKLPRKSVVDEEDPQLGVWKHNDNIDDSDWDPLEVVVSKDPVTFLDPTEPQGIVAVEEGTTPNKNGKLDPIDLNFFTPGEKPPPKFNKVGHWRPGKLNQEWPPRKAKLPSFLGKIAKVVPLSNAPAKQESKSQLTGVWKHSDDTDDTDWEPVDVVITKDPIVDDLGRPHGVVALAEGVEPESADEVKPSDLKFFTPGEEPPPIFKKVGHWKPNKLNQEWPPKKTELSLHNFDGDFAKVFPKSKLEQSTFKDPPLMGVWEHNDDTDDCNWNPIGVFITKEPEGEFNGIVAVEEGVKPDKAGKLDPSDLKFFTPEEEPPSNYNKVGHWRPAEAKGWPPVAPPKPKSLRNVGKLKIPGFDKVPERGVVYPQKTAPKSHDDAKEQIIAKGVWKWSKPENKPKDSDSWIPSNVEMFEDGNEPHDWDDKKQNGVWGVNPAMDCTMNPKPSDIWFYPPDEKVDEDFKPAGKWRPSTKEKPEWSYPPKPVRKIEDTRKFKKFEPTRGSVGKLRVPSFFKNK